LREGLPLIAVEIDDSSSSALTLLPLSRLLIEPKNESGDPSDLLDLAGEGVANGLTFGGVVFLSIGLAEKMPCWSVVRELWGSIGGS